MRVWKDVVTMENNLVDPLQLSYWSANFILDINTKNNYRGSIYIYTSMVSSFGIYCAEWMN